MPSLTKSRAEPSPEHGSERFGGAIHRTGEAVRRQLSENGDVPGQMVASLHGVQGGDEGAFARLYAETNPVLLRYLRVVSDADPAPLAHATWATLLHVIPAFDADDDDDWLELTLGTARRRRPRSGRSRPVPATSPADAFDEVVEALRACGPATADVLAMHVVAGLGRDSIARITGQEPTEVLALVHQGQESLSRPAGAPGDDRAPARDRR